VAITHDEVGTFGAAGWSTAFRRSEFGAAVFEVSATQRHRVLDWAGRQPIPRSSRRPVHEPSVDAWAVLDGGIVHLYGYALTTLPAGMYVVGLQAFRLLLAELGFSVPDGLTAATTITPDELRRRHRAVAIGDPSGVEQADMLATCTDAVMLRWVATTLLAEYGTAGAGQTGR
jgi:hypothetical protein